MDKMEGIVIYYSTGGRGYGFITGDDGTDYFVQSAGLTKGTKLTIDDRVTFRLGKTKWGLHAEEVSLVIGDLDRTDTSLAEKLLD